MDSGSVARRYAKALFSLAVESERVEAWSEALGSLARILSDAPDVAEVLANRVHTREERRAIAQKLVEALKLDREPANMLYLLADRNRLDRTTDVLQAFGDLADAHLGRLRARLSSAVPIDPDALDAMAGKLSDITRATVLLERSIEPELLGGVVAQVGSLVYDGSVRTQLENLKKSLKR
jgi:F-type H+-transporting ATPase subunit delta